MQDQLTTNELLQDISTSLRLIARILATMANTPHFQREESRKPEKP